MNYWKYKIEKFDGDFRVIQYHDNLLNGNKWTVKSLINHKEGDFPYGNDSFKRSQEWLYQNYSELML
jgi:hypothetical protein